MRLHTGNFMKIPKNTKPKIFCFVLMPFSEKFDDIYHRGIKPACVDSGAYCERVDEQLFQGAFIERIYNQIAKADFIIADMTGQNPNVFYEVGYAHALGKPTVLLTQDFNDIPSDLRHLIHIVYDGKIHKLYDELANHVKNFVEMPAESRKEPKFEIELYMGEKQLSAGPTELISERDDFFSFRGSITLHNTGTRKISSDEYTFNVLSNLKSTIIRYLSTYSVSKQMRDLRISSQDRENLDEVVLPNHNFQYTLRNPPTLLPNAYEAIEIDITCTTEQVLTIENEFTLRIITENGSRDFGLVMKLPRPDNV